MAGPAAALIFDTGSVGLQGEGIVRKSHNAAGRQRVRCESAVADRVAGFAGTDFIVTGRGGEVIDYSTGHLALDDLPVLHYLIVIGLDIGRAEVDQDVGRR